MGLFGKKENCAVCGKPVSGIMHIALTDGKACSVCRSQCSPMSRNLTTKCANDIRRHLDRRAMDAAEFKEFSPTDSVQKFLQVNRQTGRWCAPVAYGKSSPDMFNLSEIVDFSLDEDGVTVSKGGLGSAVVGAALAGGVGAIVGAGLGRKQKELINKMSVIINLKNEFVTTVEIPLITTQSKRNSMTYRVNKSLGDQIVSLLTAVTADIAQVPSSTPASGTDELLKYKQLLDAGAITQDDYDQIKDRILGLN